MPRGAWHHLLTLLSCNLMCPVLRSLVHVTS